MRKHFVRPYHHKAEENVFSFPITSIAAGWCLTLGGHVGILIEILKHVSASVTTAQQHYISLHYNITYIGLCRFFDPIPL